MKFITNNKSILLLLTLTLIISISLLIEISSVTIQKEQRFASAKSKMYKNNNNKVNKSTALFNRSKARKGPVGNADANANANITAGQAQTQQPATTTAAQPQGNQGAVANKKEEMKAKWSQLFNNVDENTMKKTCKPSGTKRDEIKKKNNEDNKYLHNPFPRKKANVNDRGYAQDDASYWFDYLMTASDFKQQITTEFKNMWDGAMKMEKNEELNVYSIDNQLKYLSSMGLASKIPDTLFSNTGNDEQKMQVLGKLNPNINPEIFNVAITIQQMNNVIQQWNWTSKKLIKYVEPAKYLVDKYDFDGDGRLNAREFIFLSIHFNEDILGSSEPMQFVYKNLIVNVIKPFFSYVDCDGDGLVAAEDIWRAGSKLKRTDQNFDIYKCDAKEGDEDSDYRTSSVNDVVLKSSEAKDGYLNEKEFIRAMLLGFWDRMVDETGPNETGNGKRSLVDQRWQTNGTVDIECDKIKKGCGADTKNSSDTTNANANASGTGGSNASAGATGGNSAAASGGAATTG